MIYSSCLLVICLCLRLHESSWIHNRCFSLSLQFSLCTIKHQNRRLSSCWACVEDRPAGGHRKQAKNKLFLFLFLFTSNRRQSCSFGNKKNVCVLQQTLSWSTVPVLEETVCFLRLLQLCPTDGALPPLKTWSLRGLMLGEVDLSLLSSTFRPASAQTWGQSMAAPGGPWRPLKILLHGADTSRLLRWLWTHVKLNLKVNMVWFWTVLRLAPSDLSRFDFLRSNRSDLTSLPQGWTWSHILTVFSNNIYWFITNCF